MKGSYNIQESSTLAKISRDNIVRTLETDSSAAIKLDGVFLSIQIQSNNSKNLRNFFDKLEQSADDLTSFEVIIKIDDDNIEMNQLLEQEVKARKFRIKYISTPLIGGFFELWRSMNDMFKLIDESIYFVLNLNDEMSFASKGWDSILKNYMGLYADGIYRLRTSKYRFRNYTDCWECGFAPETSAVTSRRWIETGGDWNPCLGPDTFQQCVAYYFGKHQTFQKEREYREIVINDIVFEGEVAGLGLSKEQQMKRFRGGAKAWFRLMSYEIQLEASRRAAKLLATIWAEKNRIASFKLVDSISKRRLYIEGVDEEGNNVTVAYGIYEIGKLKHKLITFKRYFYYCVYGGGGITHNRGIITEFSIYLCARFDFFYNLHSRQVSYLRYFKNLCAHCFKKLRTSANFMQAFCLRCFKNLFAHCFKKLRKPAKFIKASCLRCFKNLFAHCFKKLRKPAKFIRASCLRCVKNLFAHCFKKLRKPAKFIRVSCLRCVKNLFTYCFRKLRESANFLIKLTPKRKLKKSGHRSARLF